MKMIFTVILSFSPLLINAQTLQDTLSYIEFYRITEAYFTMDDTSLILKETFVDQPSAILIITMPSDSSIIISIDHGKDKVIYLGYATEIENPINFEVNGEDPKFYHWLCGEHDVEETQEAVIFKEYITGSNEKRGSQYFFFDFVFKKGFEMQFYGYKVDLSK